MRNLSFSFSFWKTPTLFLCVSSNFLIRASHVYRGFCVLASLTRLNRPAFCGWPPGPGLPPTAVGFSSRSLITSRDFKLGYFREATFSYRPSLASSNFSASNMALMYSLWSFSFT